MVFVLDRSKKPLNMISHAQARILLKNRLAVVHKIYPFTIRLKDNSCVSNNKAYTVKIDPGSRTTGVAITDNNNSVVMLAEIEHRGHIVKKNLDDRRVVEKLLDVIDVIERLDIEKLDFSIEPSLKAG